MIDGLSGRLVDRLKQRAGDGARRSDEDEMAANSVGFGALLDATPKSDDPAVHEYLAGMNSPFAGMIANLVTGDGGQAKGFLGAIGTMLGGKRTFGMMGDGSGGATMFRMGGSGDPAPLRAPCGEADVVAAEAVLDFVLPAPLRQYYLEVADGGVGPGGGLYSLKQMLAKWDEFTREPIGPRGQKWPAKLLPIQGDDWDVTCIDRESGKLVFWDVEELSYGGWKKSFCDEAESLEAWLDKWLCKPSLAEKAKARAERPAPTMLTDEDWNEWGKDDPLHADYLKRLEVATMTPEERAANGYSEDNWHEEAFEGFDLMGITMPTPGYADRKRGKGG